MPTMQDVANRAGVSLSTVSHALSGKRPISEETRARIQEAIDELGYRPNELARRLANKQSKIIGLFFPKYHSSLSEMQFEFISSAIDTAEEFGYAILLWRSPKDIDQLINLTQQGLVDGVIFMEVRLEDERMIRLRESGFPFSMIGRTGDDQGIGFVDLDHTKAVEDAFQYLVDQGHQKIAYIDYPDQLGQSRYAPAVFCWEGYQRAIQKHALPIISGGCDTTPQCAYQLVLEILEEHPDLTALFTPNEAGLSGMYEALKDSGKNIPDDFSIISLASARRAEKLLPSLTTMDFPTEEMGKLGVEILVRILNQEVDIPPHRLLEAKLSVRQSSGPAPV